MAAGDVDVKITSTNGKLCTLSRKQGYICRITAHQDQYGSNMLDGFSIGFDIYALSIGETNGCVCVKTLGIANLSTAGYSLHMGVNKLTFSINDGTEISSAANSIQYMKWYHVLMTVSSAQICTFYIDGVVSGTPGDLVQTISTITTFATIGLGRKVNATNRDFDGAMRHFKFWNRVLTASEIADDYAGKVIWSDLLYFIKLGGDLTNYGVGLGAQAAIAETGGLEKTRIDDTVKTIVAAQRGASTDTWLCCSVGQGMQILTTNIRQA